MLKIIFINKSFLPCNEIIILISKGRICYEHKGPAS